MGLALSVGIMQELRENDTKVYETFREYFQQLNQALERMSLPRHHEPEEIAPDYRVSFEMFGYSGLHYLRRIAAYKQYTSLLPPPGDDKASNDSLLQRYYQDVNVQWEQGLMRLVRTFQRLQRNRALRVPSRSFDHLIDHSDCESFYLPMSFTRIFAAQLGEQKQWQQIGSSYKLLDECKELANFLRIPEGIDPESEELWEACESQGKGDGWKRYGVESFTCVRLMRACEASIASGAAVVFC